MIETLFGGLMGGLFRMAPELLKVVDRKNERAHELRMLEAEMEFAKIRSEIQMRQVDADMTIAEMHAIREALKEQGQTARAAGRVVAAISALVRPLITYWLIVLYSVVKIAALAIGIQDGGDWKEVVVTAWGSEDMAILMMILSFWFVGRVYERQNKQ
jgi:hypothetical protein